MKKIGPVLLILLLVVIGCKLPRFLTGGSKGATATGGSDPKADVVAASKKFIDLPFFTAKMDGVGQTEIKSQVEYFAPDRYRIKYLGGTGKGMEMIWIGKDSYMKLNEGWVKMATVEATLPTLRDSFTEEGLKSLTDVKFEGEDTVDGKSALAYSYKNVTPVGNYPFTSKIWIGYDTGVPMKVYVEYTNGTLKNMTVNYDTESKVTIEPPTNMLAPPTK